MSGHHQHLLLGLTVVLAACLVGCVPSAVDLPAPPTTAPTSNEPDGALGVAGCCGEGTDELPTVSDAELQATVKGSNAFAVTLYKQLAETEGNVVVSPRSVSTALAMMYAGARGETAEEMAKVLGFGQLGEKVHAAQFVLGSRLSQALNVGKQEFRSSNSLWLDKATPFEGDFLRVAKSRYGAKATEVDFQSAPESAVGAINKWAEKETAGRVRNLLDLRDVPEGTQLVLANATYLKGLWRFPFDVAKTEDGEFRTASGGTVKVRMMRQELPARFWQGDGLAVASIPYRDNSASLLLVVPDAADGLAAIENTLTPKLLAAWDEAQEVGDLSIRLPRFSARFKRDLVPSLKAIGFERTLGKEADFRGMSAHGSRVSKVVHEAIIEVNEEGAEATAATAVVGVTPVSAPATPKRMELTVDRPFLFAVYDHKTRSVLFLGRVVTPD